MELARRTFHASRGWHSPLPVALDGPQTLVLAFGASALPPAVLAELAAAFPQSALLGCSTAGEIHGAEIFDDSLSVAVARFEHTHLRQAKADVGEASDSREAGRQLAAALAAPDLRAVLVMHFSISQNGLPQSSVKLILTKSSNKDMLGILHSFRARSSLQTECTLI